MRGSERSSPVAREARPLGHPLGRRVVAVGEDLELASGRARATAQSRSEHDRAASSRRGRAPRRRSSSRSRRGRARRRRPSGRSCRSAGRPRLAAIASAIASPAAASVAASARKRAASSRVYGDGTRVQRGISGSWQAATIVGDVATRARARTVISPSDSRGLGMGGTPPVWRRPATMPAPMHRPLARLAFWSRRRLLAWTQVGYGLFLAALRRRARRPAAGAPGGRAGTPSVALIVAAYAEEAVIAAKVANALALDWPRDRLAGHRRRRRRRGAGRRRHRRAARARPAPTSCSSCRAAARCARRTPRSPRPPASCSRSPTPTRAGSPARCARSLAPFADPAVGYVCGQVAFVNEAGHEPGGRRTGATRCGCARTSRRSRR